MKLGSWAERKCICAEGKVKQLIHDWISKNQYRQMCYSLNSIHSAALGTVFSASVLSVRELSASDDKLCLIAFALSVTFT